MFCSRPVRRASVATALLVATTAAALTTAVPAHAVAVIPRAPVVLPSAAEAAPSYQPQTFCDPVNKPGPVALGQLLTATYPDTSVVDISRPCASDTSEHYDGRALDWGANYKNTKQVAEVNEVFSWLFAKDAAGNPNAMLRRLGIMYIIWNKKIWGSWSQSWQPYACSGVTACHQDHVHFSFDWAGAEKKTSFWTGKVAGYVAPPKYVYTSTRFAQLATVNSKTTRGIATTFWVKAGLSYRFTVTGTYRYDATTTHRADAECSTVDGKTWKSLATGDTSSATGLLDLWVDTHRSWSPSPSTGGGCNTSTHAYTRTLTFPTTELVHLRVNDPTPTGDSGSLKVTIQRI